MDLVATKIVFFCYTSVIFHVFSCQTHKKHYFFHKMAFYCIKNIFSVARVTAV